MTFPSKCSSTGSFSVFSHTQQIIWRVESRLQFPTTLSLPYVRESGIQFILHACAAFPSQSLYSAVSSTDIVYFDDWVTMRMDTGRTVNPKANSVGGNAHSRLDMLLEQQATTSGRHLSQKSRKAASTKACNRVGVLELSCMTGRGCV